MHYLLFYDLVDDYVTRRQPHRAAHLKYARPFVERGELLKLPPWLRHSRRVIRTSCKDW
jgi:hypothetical protein